MLREKEDKLAKYSSTGYCQATGSPQRGRETVFINAAIEGAVSDTPQLPWVVDLDLLAAEKDSGHGEACVRPVATGKRRRFDAEDASLAEDTCKQMCTAG